MPLLTDIFFMIFWSQYVLKMETILFILYIVNDKTKQNKSEIKNISILQHKNYNWNLQDGINISKYLHSNLLLNYYKSISTWNEFLLRHEKKTKTEKNNMSWRRLNNLLIGYIEIEVTKNLIVADASQVLLITIIFSACGVHIGYTSLQIQIEMRHIGFQIY